MTDRLRRPPALALLALMTCGAAVAQADRAGAQTAPAATPASPASKIDPVAMQALKSLGAYLKTLQSFEIGAKTLIETNVEDSDIKVTIGMDNVYKVQRPDRFFISLRSDRQQRDFYYDGKSITVSIPRQNFYAVTAAPPKIANVVDDLYDNYGIALPLSDLFVWADMGTPVDGIESALRIGYAKIGTTDTDQFTYRCEDIDLQLWIARGPHPLPMKIVITSRDPATRPSYSAELSWNLSAKFTPATFTYKPDAKASQIQLAKASSAGSN